ncbi:tyrosine-protein phosphatase [Nocardia stercoris]|uniref:Tyrosine-protein phosphatase n=1 Tax=Nocardia stercoris TaxID=2483361 RepID=A0A3M2LDN5_9NOCA|nr:tyrosine-protein phosphatase [Nocardia stercoris]RMI35524.1 tyrosine-protein phosphatase [Nocardia stercoris]
MIRPRTIGATVVLAAALTFGVSPGLAFAVDPPTPTPSVVLDPTARSLNLSGVINARDVGGYKTTDGHTVRTGLVFRTAALNAATTTDVAALAAHNVVSVHDLRTNYEQLLSGADKIPAGATEHHDDVLGGLPPTSGSATLSNAANAYPEFITAPGANAGFADVIKDIAYNNGGVLFHCTAGKDRTGWAGAVLLTLLGVDKATVYYDFMLSSYYRDAAPGDVNNGVTAAELDSAFAQVNTTYGSFDNYVSTGLGLTAADIAALKAKLLS